jgi:hypothetical protein
MTISTHDRFKSGIVQFGLERQTGIMPWQQVLLFLFACAVLVTRRPDAVFRAQFYAEDGRVWFADAYNLGWWNALFRAQDGYFQTFPRLAAALALLAPLSLAPLVLNLAAAAVEALPVSLLLSSRASAWGSMRIRALLAVAYLALPNSREMMLVETSSQWLLALCVFLLLTMSPPTCAAGRVFDFLILALCGLTGPFCFFLLPIAAFIAWRRGGRWRWTEVGSLTAFSLVQAWGLLVVDSSGRSQRLLGASPALFTRILAGQIYFGALLGGKQPICEFQSCGFCRPSLCRGRRNRSRCSLLCPVATGDEAVFHPDGYVLDCLVDLAGCLSSAGGFRMGTPCKGARHSLLVFSDACLRLVGAVGGAQPT